MFGSGLDEEDMVLRKSSGHAVSHCEAERLTEALSSNL